MKKEAAIFGLVLVFALSFNLVSADLANYSISTSYSANNTIKGTINISWTGIPYNSTFTTNLGGSVPVISLINSSRYTCLPADCTSSYSAVQGSGSKTKNVHLNKGESVIWGLNISGGSLERGSISNFRMDISSSAPESSAPQLAINLLKDNSLEWSPYTSSGSINTVEQILGCYNYSAPAAQNSPAIITQKAYCEEISIPPTPLVSLGASYTGTGTSNITMSINDSSNEIGSCNIVPGSSTQECIAKDKSHNNLYLAGGTYKVCVRLQQTPGTDYCSPGSSNCYKIAYEQVNPVCGTLSSDYPIYALTGNFSAPGSFTLNNTESAKWKDLAGVGTGSLESEIGDYILNKYNDDCSKGCIVPIEFSSNVSQDLTISNVNLGYVISNEPVPSPLSNLSNLSTTPPTFSTKGYQTISLDPANFSVGEFGNHTFTLNLNRGTGEQKLFSQNIEVRRVPQIIAITPTIASAAVQTNFSAKVNTYGSSSNVTSYRWNFGDGSLPVTTTTNTVLHTYDKIQSYNLSVTIRNSDGLGSTANFTITTLSPRDAANTLLSKDLLNIAKIQNTLQNYSAFTQNEIKRVLNFNQIQITLNTLKTQNASATTDQQYIKIMNSLVSLLIPSSIHNILSADSITFVPSSDSINLDALRAAGGGEYNSSREKDYINYILAWELANATAEVDYNEFSGLYGSNLEPVINTVKISVAGNPSRGNSYLIIPSSGEMHFDKNYTKSGDYYYVPLSSGPQTIEFSTTQRLSPEALPFFIAPSLNSINLPKEASNEPSNKWVILVLILLGVAFTGFVIYVIIGKWYQKRYESYLFKNKNDLYNIVTYIQSAKSRGVKNSEIERNLRRSNWSGEQLSYVMKRYAGRRIGLLGFRIRGDKHPKPTNQRNQPRRFPGRGPSGPGFR